MPIDLEDLMNDRQAFEMAMWRVKTRAQEEGRTYTFRELLKQATEELRKDYERLKASSSSPETQEP